MAPSKKRKAAAVAEAEPASDAVATPPEKRGRGRPSKAEKAEYEQLQAAATPPAKRGRPSKADKAANEQASAPAPSSSSVQKNTTTPTKASAKDKAAADTSLRRSSRHPSGAEETATATPRATRSANTDASRAVVAVKETKAKGKAKGEAKTGSPKKKAATKSHTRGIAKKKVKKAKGKGKVAPTEVQDEEEDETSSDDDDLPEDVPEKDIARGGRKASKFSVDVQSRKMAREESEDADEEDNDEPTYWLMKAEPESRMEKGKDVKFSIDDLKSASEPEGWDGVRNATARNNMRLMVKGDQAFFYHSNCKVPGIAGIMEIVEEHTPDESALDPEHPYYDPKTTADNPKWCKVRVAYRRKFTELIKLKELQKYAKEGGILQNLQTLRQSRLSVSKVSKKEWDFILSLAGDEEEDEEEADDVNASALQLSTLGAGEGGVGDADSTLTAVWTGANGTNGTTNGGINDTGDH